MTITEFLLARIVEDETAARTASAAVGSSGWKVGAFRAGPATLHAIRFDPYRVLAECEAKRRIVDLLDEHDDSVALNVVYQVIARLTLPYADHPDYDPSWAV